jgi:hypothetical protein
MRSNAPRPHRFRSAALVGRVGGIVHVPVAFPCPTAIIACVSPEQTARRSHRSPAKRTRATRFRLTAQHGGEPLFEEEECAEFPTAWLKCTRCRSTPPRLFVLRRTRRYRGAARPEEPMGGGDMLEETRLCAGCYEATVIATGRESSASPWEN